MRKGPQHGDMAPTRDRLLGPLSDERSLDFGVVGTCGRSVRNIARHTLGFMQIENTSTSVLNPAQLVRIEATHKGFLYQHLYAVACLLMARELGWEKLSVELDEDIELQYAQRRSYVQVKTRSRPVQPSDVRTALERFEACRAEHSAGRRPGAPEFVLALNGPPSQALRDAMDSNEIPEDVQLLWPGHGTGLILPQPWVDAGEAFAWCLARAESLPYLMVAPDTLVLKLAGTMMRVAAGAAEFPDHSISAEEAAHLLEQCVHQLHAFPDPPLNYRPQDNEPPLTRERPVRLIVGFSGAGKTSWAAQSALLGDDTAAYFDVADLPSGSVPVALSRELAAQWLQGDNDALQVVVGAALSGAESLRAVDGALAAHGTTYVVVVDNAHHLAADTARAIREALPHLRLVFLAQPTSELAALRLALSAEPEVLSGWGADTIAAEAQAHGCAPSMATVSRLMGISAGMPLYVRSSLQVAAAEFGADLAAFCDALDSQSLAADTAQHTILSRVFGALEPALKRVLACASIADIPLAASEVAAVAQAAFAIGRADTIRCLRRLRSNGLVQAYGSQRSKVHDAIRPIALELLADDPAAATRAKMELRNLLTRSVEAGEHRERFPLFVRMLVDLRDVETLAAMGTEEAFHEIGSFPHVWILLEEAAQDTSIRPEIRFECLDALLYHRQKNGPTAAIPPLLQSMEALLVDGVSNPDARLTHLNKSMIFWAEQGNAANVQDVRRRAARILPQRADYQRVFAYTYVYALWKLSNFDEVLQLIQPLVREYLDAMGLEPQDIAGDPGPTQTRARDDEEFAGNCKHLADCYDILARTLERKRKDPGACRALAVRLFEFSGSWDSVVRVGIDLVYQYLGANQPKRARQLLESGVLRVMQMYSLEDRVIPTRYLYAYVLAMGGDIPASQEERRRLEPYWASLTPEDQVEAQRLMDDIDKRLRP